MKFKNFSIWKKKLPHWRADEVTYYLTFRYRRELDLKEQQLLFSALLSTDQKKWDLLLLATFPECTEMIVQVSNYEKEGQEPELSKIIEPIKAKVARKIMSLTEERYSPFYLESYDRIIRDESEYIERIQKILSSTQIFITSLVQEYPFLWIREDVVFKGNV